MHLEAYSSFDILIDLGLIFMFKLKRITEIGRSYEIPDYRRDLAYKCIIQLKNAFQIPMQLINTDCIWTEVNRAHNGIQIWMLWELKWTEIQWSSFN